ncbi:16S rRNA (guanine(527)-N(7))-methyltransferase RsmG [Candidatus Peregrinibacteria bacterium]|nr:MAG: 16S rRNA (guanine(527)-N(7))-methyltransferase RsmG [Candidatus Peregrinibacteria bacterium]
MKKQFHHYGISLTSFEEERFFLLMKTFLEINEHISLSSFHTEEAVIEKHFIDSLLPATYYDFTGKSLLDIGTGGGFPGLALAIIGVANVSVLDSVGKKIKAVESMAKAIDVPLTPLIGRIEDFGQQPAYREQFDVVTARALAPLPVLFEYALPFVKLGGDFIAYLGPTAKDDFLDYKKELTMLGGELSDWKEFNIGGAVRIIAVIKKIKKTPRAYPRQNGIPKKTPLSL